MIGNRNIWRRLAVCVSARECCVLVRQFSGDSAYNNRTTMPNVNHHCPKIWILIPDWRE